ncbi:hypothetical protein [Martelella soudanensis]|uniref:hypothetical protein n=1 Tax=unclassified Martelella TaxID=2629616 RepID=UPI0015DEFFFA|nr:MULTISPECIES: hypothetical protein [unclassified Martelella]
MARAGYLKYQKKSGEEAGPVPAGIGNTARFGLNVKNLRLFNCSCHHPLRFGRKTCSYCFRPTPFYNRVPFWIALLLIGLVLSSQLLGFTFNGALNAMESGP